MKLILVDRDGANPTTIRLLRDAADKFGVDVMVVDDREPAPALDPRETVLLYRVSPTGTRVAREIARKNPCAALEWFDYGYPRDIACALAGVPMPVTQEVRSLEPEALAPLVEAVGGFPLVIKDKIAGGHGAGVTKADNPETLRSIGAFILGAGGKTLFRIQEYLPHTHHARLVVLGDEVIDSVAYMANDHDFRTNRSTEEITLEPKRFSPEMEETAIRATHASGYDFAGVDVIAAGDTHKVLEVNHPCYFARSQLCTGVPASEMIVAFLLAKAEANFPPPPAIENPPSLVLVNHPQHRNLRAAFERHTPRLGLPVTAVDPSGGDAGLPADCAYLLYRISVDGRDREREIFGRYDCTSFAGDYPVLASAGYRRNDHYREAGLPFVAKVSLTRRAIGDLQERLAEAGGVPVLVRARKGERTSFVRADSSETFLSVVDYAFGLGNRVSIQPLLDVRNFLRLVVLDGNVLTAIEYLSRDAAAWAFSDFDAVLRHEATPDVAALAVRAAESHQLQCAAVNIVVTRDGDALVEDVLFPFDFRREHGVTGIDVAGRMLDALLARHAASRV